MPEFITIQEQIERRTYLKGRFKGKYIGFLDPRNSDTQHENFYDLEVLSGEIFTHESSIRSWKEGDEFEESIPIDKFLTKLPDSILCSVSYSNGNIKHFKVNLNQPKLRDYELTNQVYEKNKVLGDINGEISGYLIHYDIEEHEIEVNEMTDEKSQPEITTTKIKTSRQTGKTELNGTYERWEYFYADNSTYWGDWQYQGTSKHDFSIWSVLTSTIQLLFLLFFVLPIFVIGWKLILPLMIIGGVFYLISILQPILVILWQWLLRLLSFSFILFLFLGIVELLKTQNRLGEKIAIGSDDKKEVTETKPDPDIAGESIISHHRIWQDYNNKTFSGNLEVKVSDYRGAKSFRNNLIYSVQETSQYNNLVSMIHDFDKNKLIRIYKMFDSLKSKNNFDNIEFAKVITSCVQDIPYTLILDNECNASFYNDDFIQKYLNNGGKCEGYVKFGLLSPTEFIGSLNGDCDTRTLLLFTILNHYNYDVAMLGSELYKHSVLGINLPINGVSKSVKGKQYIIWETTAKGIEPGIFPRELSDMRFWNVNLISNNQAI